MVTPIDAFAPATAMLAALRDRQISAVELLELHLGRIERYDGALNAIVIRDFEQARQTAAEADGRRARGEDGALLGLPLTIKDCIDVAGLRGTAGVLEHAERRPEADARLAARVRAAGAVIMGKTNVPPWAGDWQSVNPIFGRTNNPWDLERSPGGSTGGGSAALAAGLTPLEFGSDIGGSIRVPAAFCGVYGHRPSDTALTRSGHFPGNPLPNPAIPLGVQGPLARFADDLELALDVVAGPEVGEDVAWRLELPPARHHRLADFRVAVLPTIDWLPVDAEIMAAQETLVAGLRQAGATVETAQPEGFADLRHHTRVYLSLLFTIVTLGTPEAQRRAMVEESRAAGDEFSLAQAAGIEATAEQYVFWHGDRERYRAAYRAFFRDWDILLAPITLTPAFPHTDAPWSERTVDVNGQPVRYELQVIYPSVTILCGQPATAFPAGFTRSGLPIGLQAIGPYLEDRTPIRFASLVAQEFGGFQRPPGYDD